MKADEVWVILDSVTCRLESASH